MIAEKLKTIEGVRFADERLVKLTESAGKKTLLLIDKEQDTQFFRVAISGGGCNGLSYKMKFIDMPKSGDLVVESQGVFVVVDSKSALYLKGTTVDYSNKMIGGGYKFINPNATSSCSCGESFSI